MADGDIVELSGPPFFEFGEKVRLKKHIRNDGTFPKREVGDILARKGDEGYIRSIGTFLQQFYIYAVYIPETGVTIGCKRRELESLDYDDSPEEVPGSGTNG
ncbi:nitrogen fixation protein NifZ [Leptospirillum ferriphilum]|jgi:nitrogen fixation protein NifZ|uniref:Nitrogen fixation protein NifZ n=1 Tax=Leptospirillum ferriphilum TaxID=178606 RepID=A0A2I2MFR2_9BACT|nr:nitrogen fixation protein NifZ [Leptospirillum ferriphilum]